MKPLHPRVQGDFPVSAYSADRHSPPPTTSTREVDRIEEVGGGRGRHFPSLGLSFLGLQGGEEGMWVGAERTYGGNCFMGRGEKCRALAYLELGSGPVCLGSPSLLLPILWSAWGGAGWWESGMKEARFPHLPLCADVDGLTSAPDVVSRVQCPFSIPI